MWVRSQALYMGQRYRTSHADADPLTIDDLDIEVAVDEVFDEFEEASPAEIIALDHSTAATDHSPATDTEIPDDLGVDVDRILRELERLRPQEPKSSPSEDPELDVLSLEELFGACAPSSP